MSNPNPNPATRWKRGESPNPGGKPKNARNRVTKRFLEDLADDFEANGKEAIVAAREKDPARYVTIIASLLPKEMIIERPLEGLSDDELAAAIEQLRDRQARIERAGAGADEAFGEESSGKLRTLQ